MISITVIILHTVSNADGVDIVLMYHQYRKMVVTECKSKIITLILLTVLLILCTSLYTWCYLRPSLCYKSLL